MGVLTCADLPPTSPSAGAWELSLHATTNQRISEATKTRFIADGPRDNASTGYTVPSP